MLHLIARLAEVGKRLSAAAEPREQGFNVNEMHAVHQMAAERDSGSPVNYSYTSW